MPCHRSRLATGIAATVLAFPVALALTFVIALVNGWLSIFKEDIAKLGIIAHRYLALASPYVLFMILGYRLTLWKMSEKVSTGYSENHVAKVKEVNLLTSPCQEAQDAKVAELSPPPSPRQQAQSNAPGLPLEFSYETDWAKLESPKLESPKLTPGSGPAIFNIEDEGIELTVSKHHKDQLTDEWMDGWTGWMRGWNEQAIDIYCKAPCLPAL